MVLLINSNTELTALFWLSFHRLRCSFGNDSDTSDSPYRCRCWLKNCMRWHVFRDNRDKMIWWKPPLQGHNLGALHLDFFDLLASLALTVTCQAFYNARFCWPPALVWLVGRDFSSFYFCWSWTNQVLCCFFSLASGLELLFVFCMIVKFDNGCASSSSRRRRRAFSFFISSSCDRECWWCCDYM